LQQLLNLDVFIRTRLFGETQETGALGQPVVALSQLLLDLVSNKTLLLKEKTQSSQERLIPIERRTKILSLSFILYLKRAEESLGKSFWC